MLDTLGNIATALLILALLGIALLLGWILLQQAFAPQADPGPETARRGRRRRTSASVGRRRAR